MKTIEKLTRKQILKIANNAIKETPIFSRSCSARTGEGL